MDDIDPTNNFGRMNRVNGPQYEKFGNPTVGSIPTIVRSFKSAVTKRINESRSHGRPVWQRNYYEHIIMSDDEYGRIDAYINSNPANWLNDPEFS